ncbi:hypothetical protein M8C21_007866, partial [Ambrosia artemisiifolia]
KICAQLKTTTNTTDRTKYGVIWAKPRIRRSITSTSCVSGANSAVFGSCSVFLIGSCITNVLINASKFVVEAVEGELKGFRMVGQRHMEYKELDLSDAGEDRDWPTFTSSYETDKESLAYRWTIIFDEAGKLIGFSSNELM